METLIVGGSFNNLLMGTSSQEVAKPEFNPDLSVLKALACGNYSGHSSFSFSLQSNWEWTEANVSLDDMIWGCIWPPEQGQEAAGQTKDCLAGELGSPDRLHSFPFSKPHETLVRRTHNLGVEGGVESPWLPPVVDIVHMLGACGWRLWLVKGVDTRGKHWALIPHILLLANFRAEKDPL